MKKVLLFLVMILLVLVSARSLFCASNQRYRRYCGKQVKVSKVEKEYIRKSKLKSRKLDCKKKKQKPSEPVLSSPKKRKAKTGVSKGRSRKKVKRKSRAKEKRESIKKKKLKACKRKKERERKEKKRKYHEKKSKERKYEQKQKLKARPEKKKKADEKKRLKEKSKKKKQKELKKKETKRKKELKRKKHEECVERRKKRAKRRDMSAKNRSLAFLKEEMASLKKELEGLKKIKTGIASVETQEAGPLEIDQQEPEVDYAIDTHNPVIEFRRTSLKNKVDRLIASEMDAASLDGILNLLDSEIALVRSILKNNSGGRVSAKRKERDASFGDATKSALVLYETIMNFAANDFALDKQIEQERDTLYLKSSQKREYLKRVWDVLKRYRMEIGYKQHRLAHGRSVLPTSRYQKYFADGTRMDGVINTSIDAFGTQTEQTFEQFPYFSSLITRSGEYLHDLSFTDFEAKDNVSGTIGKFRGRFADLWSNNLNSMKAEDVVDIVDEVLLLVGHEVANHSESLQQRNKMFARSENTVDMNANIAVSSATVPSCKKSNVLFGTIRNAAALNTMSSGSWNPDLYEDNLRRYAKNLKNFANKIESVCLQKGERDCFGSCCLMRHSLDNLISSIVFSSFAGSV